MIQIQVIGGPGDGERMNVPRLFANLMIQSQGDDSVSFHYKLDRSTKPPSYRYTHSTTEVEEQTE